MSVSKFTKQPIYKHIVSKINEIIDNLSTGVGANVDLSNLSTTGEAHFGKVKTINNTSPDSSGNVSLTIPTVNNSTITIQKNSTTVDTFTLNQSTAKTINITVPTDTGDLTNGAGFITGITSAMVTGALGYTPYNSTNPSGYQANVIETIKVNNVAQTVTSKTVNITVPSAVTESTVSGWGFTKNTGTVTSVNNVSPVNGNVSLTIPTVNNATLTIQKNGTTVKTFTANASSDVTANITVPTKTSDLTNDSGYTTNVGTVTKVNNTSPDANGNVSLTIPTVNNATLTIQKNSTTVKTFTANASTDVTCNITVPTKTSDLTNDSSFITGITSSDVTTALGYTPYDSSNPNGYTTNVGTVTSVNNTSPDTNGNVTISIPSISGLANTDLSNLSSTGKTVLDGQWVSLNQTIYESQSLNNSNNTRLESRVNVPNDGKVYEVLFTGLVETTTTSGNYARLQIETNQFTSRYCMIAGCITRTASNAQARGSVIMPIKGVASDAKNLYTERNSNFKGTANLYALMYRRVGTNT